MKSLVMKYARVWHLSGQPVRSSFVKKVPNTFVEEKKFI